MWAFCIVSEHLGYIALNHMTKPYRNALKAL